MNELHLSAQSLGQIPIADPIVKIVRAALAAVDPYQAVLNTFQIEDNKFKCGEQVYSRADIHQLWVIGAGKAGFPMAKAIQELFSEWNPRGCVIVKEGHSPQTKLNPGLTLRAAGHPIPDERGIKATQEIIELLAGVRADDLVICLISGGGSALLSAPAAGLTLQDLQSTTEWLLRAGADIEAINRVRKHLDTIKGGGLARRMTPAQGITLILSDVLGDSLESIASGPTVPDSSTYQDALTVLEQFDLVSKVPQRVLWHLQNGANGLVDETAKPGDSCFERLSEYVIGSNKIAARAACAQAAENGFNPILLTTYLQGEARQAGRFLAAILKQVAATDQPVKRPAMLVAGGETTVTVRGDGLGGRNLECALGAVPDMDGLRDTCLLTLATDGGDGPTDAAGAIVTGDTLRRALSAGLLPEDYLARNDSYHFFAALGDLLKPGPTLTNVNDLIFGFAW